MDWKQNLLEQFDDVAPVLQTAKTVAVVGIKDTPYQPAFYVPQYLQKQGYRIIPVNPKLKQVLGERCFSSLLEIKEPVDIVNLFRAPENIPSHAEEALRLKPLLFWMQTGIRHPEAAAMLAQAGIYVVQDRCMYQDHIRLMRGAPG
jgi:hypothetical protein